MINLTQRTLIAALCALSCTAFGAFQFTPDDWNSMVPDANDQGYGDHVIIKHDFPDPSSTEIVILHNSLTIDEGRWNTRIRYERKKDSYTQYLNAINEIQKGRTIDLLKGHGVGNIIVGDKFWEKEKRILKEDKITFFKKNWFTGKETIFKVKAITEMGEKTTYTRTDANDKKENINGFFRITSGEHTLDWTFKEPFTIKEPPPQPPPGTPLPGPLAVTVLSSLFYTYIKKKK